MDTPMRFNKKTYKDSGKKRIYKKSDTSIAEDDENEK